MEVKICYERNFYLRSSFISTQNILRTKIDLDMITIIITMIFFCDICIYFLTDFAFFIRTYVILDHLLGSSKERGEIQLQMILNHQKTLIIRSAYARLCYVSPFIRTYVMYDHLLG